MLYVLVQVPGYLPPPHTQLQDRGGQGQEGHPHHLDSQRCLSTSLGSLRQGELYQVQGAGPGGVSLVQHALPRERLRHHPFILHYRLYFSLLCCSIQHSFCAVLEVSERCDKLFLSLAAG